MLSPVRDRVDGAFIMRLFRVVSISCLFVAATSASMGQHLSQPYSGDTNAYFTPVAAPTGYTATVNIYNSCSVGATAISGAAVAVPAAGTQTETAIPLTDAGGTVTTLRAKDTICAVETYTAEAAGSPALPPTTVAGLVSDRAAAGDSAAPPGFDWGLVRAYFTLGALLSQQDNQFSHEDMFLSFRLDKTYRQMGRLEDTGKHSFKPGLNSFFETRLTALPVAVQPCAMTTTGSGSTATTTAASAGCSSASTVSATGSGTGSGAAAASTTTVFLNSQKTARLLFGIYAPFALNQWKVATKDAKGTGTTTYSLFLGPLVKTGFDTSLNGLNQTQQQGSTPMTVQPVGSPNEFYKFYDFGFRLGHLELKDDPAVAPEMLSYLDVTWGRFSNMASLLCPRVSFQGGASCAAPSTTTGSGSTATTTTGVLPWAHDYRLNVEGLLEVPALKGFSIGFSANVAPWGFKTSGPSVHIRPQDDLRFLFAYRFDISEIAKKLAGQ
jgi:hypothetical protein